MEYTSHDRENRLKRFCSKFKPFALLTVGVDWLEANTKSIEDYRSIGSMHTSDRTINRFGTAATPKKSEATVNLCIFL